MHKNEKKLIKDKHKRLKKKYNTVKCKLAGVENELKRRHSWEKRKLQNEHSERLSKQKKTGKSRVKDLQDLTLAMREMMQCHAADNDINQMILKDLNRKIRGLSKSDKSYKDRSVLNKAKMTEWKEKHDSLMDALAEEQRQKGELSDEVLQWKETVVCLEDRLMECHDTIHDMTPIIIKKVWVKNVGKRGK